MVSPHVGATGIGPAASNEVMTVMDYTSTAWNVVPAAALFVLTLGMAGFALMDYGRARAAALFASRTAPAAAQRAQAPDRAAA
jgi:hypothetical protein